MRFEYDEKAFQKRIKNPPAAVPLLIRFRQGLQQVEPFTESRLEDWMREWVVDQGIKMGDIIHPVRVALTGKEVGFGLFDTFVILGKDRCLMRIDRALAKARRDEPAG